MRHHTHARRSPTKGFTLIEMIAVLVIIGLIVSIGVPSVMNYIASSRQTKAVAQTKLLYNALTSFNIHCGRYPTTDEGLEALIIRPGDAEGWNGPYIENWIRIPKDPYNQPYEYEMDTDEYGKDHARIICRGKDKRPGGKGLNADIINGEKRDAEEDQVQ